MVLRIRWAPFLSAASTKWISFPYLLEEVGNRDLGFDVGKPPVKVEGVLDGGVREGSCLMGSSWRKDEGEDVIDKEGSSVGVASKIGLVGQGRSPGKETAKGLARKFSAKEKVIPPGCSTVSFPENMSSSKKISPLIWCTASSGIRVVSPP